MEKLKLGIQNSTGLEASEIFIGFWEGGAGDLMGTVAGQPMKSINYDNTWYKLSELQPGEDDIALTNVVLEPTSSGRLYVSLGKPFENQGGGMPSFVSDQGGTNASFYTQYDKIELTYDGGVYGVADLTTIDYYAIPMNLRTYKYDSDSDKYNPVGELHAFINGSDFESVVDELKELGNPENVKSLAEDLTQAFENAGHPLPDGVIQAIQNPPSALIEQNGKFVRVIGPNSYPPLGEPSKGEYPGLPFTPYNPMLDYLKYLSQTFAASPPDGFSKLGNGVVANLKGKFVGSQDGTGPLFEKQTYEMEVKLDQDLNLTIFGTTEQFKEGIEIYINKWDLLDPAGLYGGNPKVTIKNGPQRIPGEKNDLYAWIFGDFFAGLNIGAVGAPYEIEGEKVGNMTSDQWYLNLPNKEEPSKSILFGKLWEAGHDKFYNPWSAVLNDKSQAYNFAYAERFSAPQLSLNPKKVDVLTVEILAADFD